MKCNIFSGGLVFHGSCVPVLKRCLPNSKLVTASGQTTTLTYDGDGQRVKKVDAGGTTYYVGGYYEVKGSTVTKYYYLGGQRVAMRAGGVLYYLHGDHLGSTSLTTSISQTVVAQQRYYPYGEVRWSSGTLPTDYRFTGQREESGIKLYDYQARYYSPYLARFISPDTLVPGIGSQALSRYMYVNGNPLLYTDPTGHCGSNNGMPCFSEDSEARSYATMVVNTRALVRALSTIVLPDDHLSPASTLDQREIASSNVVAPVNSQTYENAGPIYGQTHPGIDFSPPRYSQDDEGPNPSTFVWSIADGTIRHTGYDWNGYGYYAVVEYKIDGETVFGLYAHLAKGSLEHYNLDVGSSVHKSQVIGVLCVGNTRAGCGNSAATHLHFEIRKKEGYPLSEITWAQLNEKDAEGTPIYPVDNYFYNPSTFIEGNR